MERLYVPPIIRLPLAVGHLDTHAAHTSGFANVSGGPGSATLGALTPADEPQNPTNPQCPEQTLGGQGSGLTGEARTVFINKTIDERNSVLDSSTRLLSLRKRDGR